MKPHSARARGIPMQIRTPCGPNRLAGRCLEVLVVSFSTWVTARRDWLEVALLETCAEFEPEELRSACRYPLATGGKRFRPLLCIAACEALGGGPEAALLPALALELVHTFSLVHDDLPCMDDDNYRRGRPTIHSIHGEAVGMLVGDALLAEAFSVLAPAGAEQVRELARATGPGMVAGQYLDITASPDIGVAALERLHRAKTGALIQAAARMGGRAGQASPSQLEALTVYGDAVGLAFQLQDDVLDADQDRDPTGPPSFVKCLGLDATRARAMAELERALQAVQGLPDPSRLIGLARFTVERSG